MGSLPPLACWALCSKMVVARDMLIFTLPWTHKEMDTRP